MIIDSHEHLMLPVQMQLEKMTQAGIDKAVLFCTAPHPERAENFQELKQEITALNSILSGSHSREDTLSRLQNNILELTTVLKQYPDNSTALVPSPLDYL